MRRVLPRLVPQRDDELRGPEIRDLDRSGDFSRMLPSEAVWLMHPTLARAWHARRAENALLVYRAEEDVDIVRLRDQEVADGADVETTRRVRGPVIVCLDTSGSMAGSAGALAKAIVLHVTMTAHDEERPVYLYAFSGPGDVVEHELSFDGDGAEALLAFLVLDYAGGTDVAEPLRRALDRHDQAEWSRADLLLVSDGGFAAPRELVAALAKRRAEKDLRVHGLLLGDHAHANLGALPDRPPLPRLGHRRARQRVIICSAGVTGFATPAYSLVAPGVAVDASPVAAPRPSVFPPVPNGSGSSDPEPEQPDTDERRKESDPHGT